MDGRPIVYLDSANSSQKPRVVIDAMSRFMGTAYAPINRSAYRLAAEATAAVAEARAAGGEDWSRGHIAAEVSAADHSTLARMEEGSHRHALRRSHEMAAASELLAELDVPSRVARASQLWLEDLAAGR